MTEPSTTEGRALPLSPSTEAGRALLALLDQVGDSYLSGVSFPTAEDDIIAIEEEARRKGKEEGLSAARAALNDPTLTWAFVVDAQRALDALRRDTGEPEP